MPRVAQQPHTNGLHVAAATPYKSPMKIPLNDDRREKAARLQSRQALHEMQMNQIKAAATPLRKRKSLGGAGNGSPSTSNDVDKENQGGGAGVTPIKRVPILANFEEWMKMATDNKINAANSWNFALIDYFHDMSLLKEGNSVNFQKASCTLDGCVKIYTSRVDSVATETGKLLSGLADGGSKKRKGDEEEAEGGDGDGEGEDEEGGAKKKPKKRAQRSSEATLVDSFEKLQLKKMELEFSVDPLFKKASADFDEGGAKGLLLNHLAIDGQGRIVFDSSDDVQNSSRAEVSKDQTNAEISANEEEEDKGRDAALQQDKEEDVEIDLAALASKFFPYLSVLDTQDICPSLKNFELGDTSGSLDIPFLKAPEDWKKDPNEENGAADRENTIADLEDGNVGLGFDDDDGPLDGGFELVADTGFGEGGEAWAREAALEPQLRVYNNGPVASDVEAEGDAIADGFDANATRYAVTLDHPQHAQQGAQHDNILAYFDTALSRNWAGPEHWRIRRIKSLATSKNPSAPTTTVKRKEKIPFEIDFAAPMTQQLADQLYTKASSASTILLPKKEWKSKNRNLLPDDKHFNSRTLLRLFLKPKARIGSIRRIGGSAGAGSEKKQTNHMPDLAPGEEMDEQFWARRNAEEARLNEQEAAGEDTAQAANYDANFFQDDGLGGGGGMDDDVDDDFADAREEFSPAVDGAAEAAKGGEGGQGIDEALALPSSSQATEGGFGAQLVTQSRRLRPEYVQYARVAKKVDVRRLKEEMWKEIGSDSAPSTNAPQDPTSAQPIPTPPPSAEAEQPKQQAPPAAPLKFTTIINSLKSVYSPSAMADISTSYCFICLLHLANEKGLVLNNEDGWTDLGIRRDESAEIVAGGGE